MAHWLCACAWLVPAWWEGKLISGSTNVGERHRARVRLLNTNSGKAAKRPGGERIEAHERAVGCKTLGEFEPVQVTVHPPSRPSAFSLFLFTAPRYPLKQLLQSMGRGKGGSEVRVKIAMWCSLHKALTCRLLPAEPACKQPLPAHPPGPHRQYRSQAAAK